MGKTGEVVRNDKTSLLLKHDLESTKLVWWAPGAVQVECLETQMDEDDATEFEDQYVIEEEGEVLVTELFPGSDFTLCSLTSSLSSYARR